MFAVLHQRVNLLCKSCLKRSYTLCHPIEHVGYHVKWNFGHGKSICQTKTITVILFAGYFHMHCFPYMVLISKALGLFLFNKCLLFPWQMKANDSSFFFLCKFRCSFPHKWFHFSSVTCIFFISRHHVQFDVLWFFILLICYFPWKKKHFSDTQI